MRVAGPALGQPHPRIDAESCVLTRRGDVLLPDPADADQPDEDVELLRALLAGREMPDDLEQLAYGPPPKHLGDALAMFSRPDRRADIAAVALRGLAADAELERAVSLQATVVPPPAAPSTPNAPADDIAQLRAQVGHRPAAPPAPEPPSRSTARISRFWNTWATVAAVAAVGGIAVGYWATNRPPMPPAPAQAMPEALLPAELNDWWHVVGSREADIELARARAPRRTPSAVDRAPALTTGRRASSERAGAADAVALPVQLAPAEPSAAPLPRALADPPPAAVPADVPVYSRRSAGVEPPVMMYPRMPKSAFPEPDETIDGQYLEVLVDQTGGVEAVRLRGLSGPRQQSYHYSMIMAAAKAWQFVPALLDGQPVRYVTRVVLEP